MGIPFHESVYGHRFFDVQLLKLIQAINRLAEATETNNRLLAEAKDSEKHAEKTMFLCRRMIRSGNEEYIPFYDIVRCNTAKEAIAWADKELTHFKKQNLWPIPETEMQFLEMIATRMSCNVLLYHNGDPADSDPIMLSVKAI